MPVTLIKLYMLSRTEEEKKITQQLLKENMLHFLVHVYILNCICAYEHN